MSADEPMAVVRWRFPSQHMPDIMIEGSSEVRERSRAEEMVKIMNAEYGDGSHWVEVLNETYAERVEPFTGGSENG